jgi:hypothetical protein
MEVSVSEAKDGDIIARLSPHRKAEAIELLYEVATNQPL